MTNATNKTPAELRAEVIADFEASIAENNEALRGLENVLLGQGYVVVAEGGLALAFDISDDKQVTNPHVCGGARRATRFTQRDAERIAANVENGNKEKAKAMHVIDALMDENVRTAAIVAQLKALG